MHDRIDALDGAGHGIDVPDVADDEVDGGARGQGVAGPDREVIQQPQAAAPGGQPANEIASDEAAAPGDEDGHSFN